MINIVYAIICICVLVFVHELGHFFAAKLCGVRIEKFSIGFGPVLCSRRFGETEYLISAIPVGGYVRLTGEGDMEQLDPALMDRAFSAKSPLQRIGIVAAGPVFNMLFALVIVVLVYLVGIQTATSRIGGLLADMPAESAGLKVGDVIVSMNGKPVTRWKEFTEGVAEGNGASVDLVVKRDGTPLSFHITPRHFETKDDLGAVVMTPIIGVSPSRETVLEQYGLNGSIVKGFALFSTITKMTAVVLVTFFEGALPLNTIASPIMIAKVAGDQAAAGLGAFLAVMALLSVNLGLLNFLPIPALDGGHIVYFSWEYATKRPVSEKVQRVTQRVGHALLLGIMTLGVYNDLMRYFFAK